VVFPVVWAVLENSDAPIPSLWRPIVSGLAAATPILIEQGTKRRQRVRGLAANLKRLPSRPHRLVPSVGDITTVQDLRALGVSPSRVDQDVHDPPPYVPRERDAEIRGFLGEHPFVLVIGDSKAGKSRSALEVVRGMFPKRRLLAPRDKDNFAALLDADLDHELNNAVVWLDDLDTYLGIGPLTRLLDEVASRDDASVMVLATIRRRVYNQYRPRRDLQSPEWKVLRERAAKVDLPTRLTDRERSQALDSYGPLDDALDRQGLGEYLAGGPDLVEKLTVETDEQVGAAIVRAAVDWRRAGLTRPVPPEMLQQLYPAYLQHPTPVSPQPEEFAAGLEWATEPIYSTVALLAKKDSGYIAFDYLLDHYQREATLVEDATWQLVLRHAADADEALSIGVAADEQARSDVAEDAFRRAVRDSGAACFPAAAFNLGALLSERDPMQAELWWRQAAEAGHVDAAFELGALLSERDPMQAELWWRQAAEAGDMDAAFQLAILIADRDPAAAKRWLFQAAEDGHADAAYQLGELLLREDDLDEAERFFYQAVDAGDAAAADQLSRLRAKREETTGKVIYSGGGRALRRCGAILDPTNRLESEMRARSESELRALTDIYRARLADGETLDDLLPEAFATVRETARRIRGQRHFDVQIVGGAGLHFGYVVEMKTGEGKTLVATLPSYLNALTGEGVHVVTVNDYLAKRDAEWMGAIHNYLGLKVGIILATMTPWERRANYAAHITYGTNNEFGFDYLRDNMALSTDELVQRGHHYAILDDIDLILIDEARTPLIISGPTEQGTRWYQEFARIAPRLRRDVDYQFDEGDYTAVITDEGIARVEEILGIENLYDSLNTPLVQHLQNALRAKELYKRDREYLVRDGEVLIVDEFTGRVLEGRRYSEGLHQAIEAKEGVRIKEENQTYATITLQNYFRLYDKLAGMTGTAKTEEAEFNHIYKLGVVEVPTNRPMIRQDHADVIYKTEEAKFEALVEEIAERHEAGQPILIGTVSIEKSERVARLLEQRGVGHSVLNAKRHEREAHIIAQAGRLGAVTVASNIAGRGVDIMLGGNVDYLAEESLRARGVDPAEIGPEEWAKALQAARREKRHQVAAEHYHVVQLGGLCVLGTERHESRRIDNQLRGRSGRQGDPGESGFFLSLEDDLMRMFATKTVGSLMDRLSLPEDVPITHRLVTRAIANAQRQVESQYFERRKNVLKYDEVMNRQREITYETRRRILEGEDLREQTFGFLGDVVGTLFAEYCPQGRDPEEWDLDGLEKALTQLYRPGIRFDELDLASLGRAGLEALLLEDAERAYMAREAQLGRDVLGELERAVLLTVLDRRWREHLYEMDQLGHAIGLYAIGRRGPLIEYEREGFDMFHAMRDSIKLETVAYILNASVEVAEDAESSRQEAQRSHDE